MKYNKNYNANAASNTAANKPTNKTANANKPAFIVKDEILFGNDDDAAYEQAQDDYYASDF